MRGGILELLLSTCGGRRHGRLVSSSLAQIGSALGCMPSLTLMSTTSVPHQKTHFAPLCACADMLGQALTADSRGVTGVLVVMRGSLVLSSLSDELATRWDGRITHIRGERGHSCRG